MPAKGETEAFLEVLLAVGVQIPLYLVIFFWNPMLSLITPAAWFSSLLLDFYTTWRFYREDPSRFTVEERNRIFSRLVSKFGFKRATMAFALAAEIPFAALLAAILIPPISSFLLGTVADPVASLSVSLMVLSLSHIQAAIKNFRIELKRRRKETTHMRILSFIRGDDRCKWMKG